MGWKGVAESGGEWRRVAGSGGSGSPLETRIWCSSLCRMLESVSVSVSVSCICVCVCFCVDVCVCALTLCESLWLCLASLNGPEHASRARGHGGGYIYQCEPVHINARGDVERRAAKQSMVSWSCLFEQLFQRARLRFAR